MLVEIIQINPKFVTELLHAEYEEKIREKWKESIFRHVVPTPDFSLPSEENIGETHKKMAKTKRANFFYSTMDQLTVNHISLSS